ncbi:MAG: heparinase II/III-family protein [Coriobacteriales bacterium]|jgi:hypothetical protein|nr:heparinase II/III-family protein [Coriobacteriales bacterium]
MTHFSSIDTFAHMIYSPIPDEVAKKLVSDKIYSLEYAGGDSLSLDQPDVLWSYIPQVNTFSIELWLKSLSFLNPLLDEYTASCDQSIRACVTGIVRSYIPVCDGLIASSKLMNSKDHLMATAVIVLIKTREIFGEDWELRPDVERLLLRIGDYLSSNTLWIPGNHGVMIDFALLHISAYLHNMEVVQFKRTALQRTGNQLETMFDHEGFCFENSVGYFDFNLRLFDLVARFCRFHAITSPELTALDATLAKATEAIRHAVLPNGMTPIIGDSGLDMTGYSSLPGHRLFKRAGFFFYKTTSSFFSFNCGFASSIHKHCDDASLTLRYNEKDIFVDCGYYCYDRRDPIRAFVAGTQGHTGFFPIGFDNLTPPEYVQTVLRASLNEVAHSEVDIALRGTISYQDGTHVIRTVSGTLECLTIHDHWEHAQSRMRQRFVLHPHAHADIQLCDGDYVVMITNGGVRAKLTVAAAGVESINCGTGYYSEHYNTYEETTTLDIFPHDLPCGLIETRVEIIADSHD